MTGRLLFAALLGTALGAGGALASDDCRAAMQDWQPREAMEAQAAAYGWERVRVRSDDGCYKVDARDGRGNEIEAKFEPDTLRIVKLEVEFAPDGTLADLAAWTDAPAD